MVTNNELLEENVQLLRDNVALQRDNLKLRRLLAEWRNLPAEPTPGDGLCMTSEVFEEHERWNEQYVSLTARTDAALADF